MDDLIRNLYYQASSYRPLENDLKNALQRAQTIRLASLLELLKEGNITSNEHLSPEQTRELCERGREVLGSNILDRCEKVEAAFKLGKGYLLALKIDFRSLSSTAAWQFRCQESAVETMTEAASSWSSRSAKASSTAVVDVKVHLRTADGPPHNQGILDERFSPSHTFEKQPGSYTVAVILWNLLKTQTGAINRLSPHLRLYEAFNDVQWFPPASSSKRIGKLYKDGKHPHPCLFAIDEKEEYVIATLSQAKSKENKARPFNGAILRLVDNKTFEEAANIALSQANDQNGRSNVLTTGEVVIRRSRWRGYWRTELPLSTKLEPSTPIEAFSSNYDIIHYK